ncbi:hypothetical protein L3V82_05920 [Thiotrichales bacterium 19S3-7]|nr:hypothetical protein [Thiotrichales bacterium 19S3-7]MCF6801632.1 hypothetical protein [Thiotrichales bacterium 19S3-11]
MFDANQLIEALFITPSDQKKQGHFVAVSDEAVHATCTGSCVSGICRA